LAAHVQIGDRTIGPGHPCYLIAEAGSNHNRDLETAYGLIDLAAEAGADAVKFQTYSAEGLYARTTPMADYLEGTPAAQGASTLFDLIRRIELPRQWHGLLARRAAERGIQFFSSPFDATAVDELVAVGVPALKIASFELTHFPLLRKAASSGIPLIVSTGMATLAEVREALAVIASAGPSPVVLLHCASVYPAAAEACNLRAMETMRADFGVPVGFSDHTLGIVVSVAAAALGADAIEKHFTLDPTYPGPDHPFALDPESLRRWVGGVRAAQEALGHGRKEPHPSEHDMRRLRRGLVLARDLPAGHVLEERDLDVKRPGTGVATRDLPRVVGKRLRKDVVADDVLRWDMLE
jgi:sialic acid synthase SpsE